MHQKDSSMFRPARAAQCVWRAAVSTRWPEYPPRATWDGAHDERRQALAASLVEHFALE